MKYHFSTSSWGGSRNLPFDFTEQEITMLSGVLHSPKGIYVNIQIMRVIVKLNELMISHKDLARKIEDLKRKFSGHEKRFIIVFEAIKQLLQQKEEPPKKKDRWDLFLDRSLRSGCRSNQDFTLKPSFERDKLSHVV